MHTAWPDVTTDQLRRVQTVSRVVLTGFGADPLFSSRITVHFQQLLQQRRFGRALSDALGYLSVEGRLSRLYLRTRLGILRNRKNVHGSFFPVWLNDDLIQRLRLRDRWESLPAPAGFAASVRPEAYSVTFAPFWADALSGFDAGVTGVPVDVRHPFFDLRLVNYLLALPRLPWCSDKQLLRDAARDYLPREVRLRRKSPLKADPLLALLRTQTLPVTPCPDPQPELAQFVTVGRVPRHFDLKDTWQAWVHLKPRSLNHWLKGLRPSPQNSSGGKDHELRQASRFKKTL